MGFSVSHPTFLSYVTDFFVKLGLGSTFFKDLWMYQLDQTLTPYQLFPLFDQWKDPVVEISFYRDKIENLIGIIRHTLE